MKERRRISGELKKRTKTMNLILILIVLLIVVFLSPKIVSTAKYILNTIHNNYISSKDFYFSSDKLSIDHTEYQITNNWSGAETLPVTINMTSKKNDMATTESDITYDVVITCSDNIECTPDTYSGTIPGTETIAADQPGSNEDFFSIDIDPKNGATLPNGTVAWVEITATASSPYTQEISGRLIIEVGSSNIYYEIADSVNSPYLTVNIVNSSAQNAAVTLSYDPTVVLLDMTDHYYLDSTATTTQQINGYAYINSVTSNVASLSTTSVRFYKINAANNYTYSGGSGTPVITMSH